MIFFKKNVYFLKDWWFSVGWYRIDSFHLFVSLFGTISNKIDKVRWEATREPTMSTSYLMSHIQWHIKMRLHEQLNNSCGPFTTLVSVPLIWHKQILFSFLQSCITKVYRSIYELCYRMSEKISFFFRGVMWLGENQNQTKRKFGIYLNDHKQIASDWEVYFPCCKTSRIVTVH